MVEQLLRMSLTASIVILVVLLIRQLLRRFPKRYLYLMWMVVWFRLLCPVSISSKLSIFNIKRAADKAAEAQISAPAAQTERDVIRRRAVAMAYRRLAARPASESYAPPAAGKIDPHTVMLSIWLIVALLVLGYAILHFVRLKMKLRDAKKVDRQIYESPLVESPFVIGLLKPIIYIPTDLGEDEAAYLIEHERAHIRRGDLIFKLFSVLAVAVHWFNPLVWLSFILFNRDMEMGCDEIVLERLGVGIRKDYSHSLVSMAKKNDDHSYVVMPVAFGKSPAGISEVKMRIDNILNFKKSSTLVAAVAGVTVLGVGLTCGLNAYADETDETGESLAVEETSTVLETETEAPVEETAVSEIAEETSAPIEESEAAPVVSGDVATSQGIYMTARPEFMAIDYSVYSYDDYCIEDMSVIPDEDTRALAQSYYDQGFFIDNPEIIQAEGSAPGDYDLMFTNGFSAHSNAPCDSYVYWDLQVYKMDETLFNYYFIDMNSTDSDIYGGAFDEVTDDGTIIRAVDHHENFDYVAEYDRSTGFATISDIKVSYSEEDFEVSPGPVTDDLSVISDDDLRAVAEELAAEGYTIWESDTDYGAWYLEDGTHTEAFSAVWQDGSTCISQEVTLMTEELFDTMFEYDEIYSVSDDGTEAVVTVIGADEDGVEEYYVYNRDTGIMVWYLEFDY